MFGVTWKSSASAAIFQEIDTDGDKQLSVDELMEAIRRSTNVEQPRVRIAELVRRFDTNSDGQLNFSEFKGLLAYLEKGHNVQQEIHDVWLRVERLQEEREDLARQLSISELATATAQQRVTDIGDGGSSSVAVESSLENVLQTKLDSAGGDEARIDVLRAFITRTSLAVSNAQGQIEDLLAKHSAAASSSRASYLRSLAELIGPPPNEPARWREEFTSMTIKVVAIKPTSPPSRPKPLSM